METTAQQHRDGALKLALDAYSRIKTNRAYALTNESKTTLAALAQAVAEQRKATGRSFQGNPFDDMVDVIHKLAAAGINVLQQRPSDAPKLPELWRHPLTNEPLPAPKTPDEKAVLGKADPELLRWFDAMEKAPYKTTLAHRVDQARRQALTAIEYGQAQHKTNPFCGTDETAKAAFFKRDRELAEFFVRESRDVEIPIFGRNRNLTTESQLAKDPATFALIKIAQRIHEDWRAQDRIAAEQQRKEAESRLLQLEAVT